MKSVLTERHLVTADKFTIIDEAGNITIDEIAVKKVIEGAKIDRASVQADGIPAGPKAFKRDKDDKLVQDDDGNYKIDEGSIPATPAWKPSADFDLTDNVWKIYEEQRNVIDTAAIDLLKSSYANVMGTKRTMHTQLARMNAGVMDDTTGELAQLNDDHKAFIKRITRMYSDLYSGEILPGEVRLKDEKELTKEQLEPTQDGAALKFKKAAAKRANEFITQVFRGLYEPLKLRDWVDGPAKRDAGLQEEISDKYRNIPGLIDGIQKLNSLEFNKEQAQRMRLIVTNMQILDSQVVNAEFYAKRTIMGAYVPFKRRGKFQIQLQIGRASCRERV